MSDTKEDVAFGYHSIMNDDPKYDAFLVFKSQTKDELKIELIARAFEGRGIRCIYDDQSHTAFPAGKPVFQSIVECIERSKTTLLLLSENSIHSSWVLLETILAVEKSKRCKIMALKIVLEGVGECEANFLKRDLLASIPCFQLNFNDVDWEEKLATYVKEEVKLPDILPVGSLAHGLVFSHFVGFYRYVLPELKKRLVESDTYKTNPGRVSTMYYILLPSSCKVIDDFESVDEVNKISIKKDSIINIKVDNHAGKPREFNLTIYSIQKEEEETYYFFADNPNVLKAIYKMKTEGLADVDVVYQVARFYHTMNEVINHGLNTDCNNAAEILPFNDEHESIHSILLDAIKRDLSRSTDRVAERVPHRLLAPRDKRQNNDVTVLFLPDVEKDRETANTISTFLKERGIKVLMDCGDYDGHITEMKIPPANWYIFVMSEETLEYNNLLAVKCMACLHDSICDNSLCVLPVIRNVHPRDIPSFIKWVTVVSVDEPDYLNVLLHTIRGKPVTMQHKIPCGDVATGLAWAYYINFLSPILKPGIRDRIGKLLKEKNIQCGCIEALFVIVPAFGRAEIKLMERTDESLGKCVIEYAGPTEKLELLLAGQVRKFFLHLFKYTDLKTGKSVCFLSEYCAAVNCLFEMTKLKFAGLTNADMKLQCKEFVYTMENIMARTSVKTKLGDISNLVKFVYYGDSEETMFDALSKQINKCSGLNLVYADKN